MPRREAATRGRAPSFRPQPEVTSCRRHSCASARRAAASLSLPAAASAAASSYSTRTASYSARRSRDSPTAPRGA